MIIDCHQHFEPQLLSLEDILKRMDKTGITKSALIPKLTDPPESKKSKLIMAVQREMFYYNPTRPLAELITKSFFKSDGSWNLWYRRFSKRQRSFLIVKKPDNQTIANIISRYDRFFGWIFLNPNNNDVIEELEKWRNFPKMIGVKLHPYWHFYQIEKINEIAECAERFKLPLIIHLGFDSNFRWLIEKFSKLKIIFAHAGVPFYKNLWAIVKDFPNVYIDLSSTYHISEKLIRKAVKYLTADKCLYGTDSPYGDEDVDVVIKSWIEDLPVSSLEKEKIFYRNFLNIIDGRI